MTYHKASSCTQGEGCVCEDTCSMDERANCIVFQNLKDERRVDMDETKRTDRIFPRVIHTKLPWYKTQYWSGFIFGIECGTLIGIPIAFVIYQVAKVVVHFIEGV